MSPLTLLAAPAPGAGGAEIGQIIIATSAALVLTAVLLWLGMGHRSGKVKILGACADFCEKYMRLPGWASFPIVVAATSLIIAVFGMYWDIALHMGVGRDPGPLANPAHYFILFGLFGIFSAGYFSIMLPQRKPSSSALRFGPGWYAPLGGVMICACGAFALIGFPLDDIWHRIFGQDVTLWGPTHLMLIGGASMTLIGIAILGVEGLRSNALARPRIDLPRWTDIAFTMALPGGLLLALSTFQAEFDFGMPQFRFVLEPVMLMLAAGIGLVSVRVWRGKGAALGAVAFFLIIRGTLTVLVGPVLGEPTPYTALYIPEAIIIELLTLVISTERTLRFGVIAGVLLGTVGLAAEWAWSHIAMPIPLPRTLASEAIPYAFAAAVAASVVGAWVGSRLSTMPKRSEPALRWSAAASGAVIVAIIALGLPKPVNGNVTAKVVLTDVSAPAGSVAAGGRAVSARITLVPPTAADHAKWLTVSAWQGGGLVYNQLKKVGPGQYVTTEPIPVHGSWKTLLRLHTGRAIESVPLYLPEDSAIPAPAVPALASFVRPFQADQAFLQREQKPANSVLTIIAYLVVGALTFGLIALLVWGLHRLGLTQEQREARARARGTAPSQASPAGVSPPQPAL